MTRATHPTPVAEVEAGTRIPFLVQPQWADEMPWLVQGITWRGTGEPFDLGLFGAQPVGHALTRWRALRETLDFSGIVHSRQVHGSRVAAHDRSFSGLLIMDGVDGHITRKSDLLLAVSVADCIPVYVVEPMNRSIGLLHVGWRGLAAGMIDTGLGTFTRSFGTRASQLRVHLGPAICGRCYEVGPEVHEQLGLARPPTAEPIDLPAIAATRAVAAGVPASAVTRSEACPRCQPERFFSHRAGSAGRQMAVIGIRPD